MTLHNIQRPILTIFVDDFNIFASVKNGIIKQIKGELTIAFNMIDIGSLVFFIGLKVTSKCKQKTIKLSQPGYIEKLFNQHRILKAKTAKILM